MSYRPAATLRGGCGAPPRPALLSLPRGGEVDGRPALGPCSMTMRVEPPMASAGRRLAVDQVAVSEWSEGRADSVAPDNVIIVSGRDPPPPGVDQSSST